MRHYAVLLVLILTRSYKHRVLKSMYKSLNVNYKFNLIHVCRKDEHTFFCDAWFLGLFPFLEDVLQVVTSISLTLITNSSSN